MKPKLRGGTSGSPDAKQPGAANASTSPTENVPVPEPEPENTNKGGRHKDIARYRASLFDKNAKAIQGLGSESASALHSADQLCQKHASEKENLKHFFDILNVRVKLLTALTNETTTDGFLAKLDSLKDSLGYQPVPEEQLRNTLVVGQLHDMNQKVLAQEKRDGVEQAANDVKNMVSIHSQIRNAVKSSTKDIELAVKSKAKKAEAAEKKRKLDLEKENKKKADAEKAAAAAANGPQKGDTLLATDLKKLETEIQQFSNFDDFEKNAKKVFGDEPFLIQQFDLMQKLLADNVNAKCQLVNFGNQFLGTQICKQTGRAQCPVVGDEIQKTICAVFDKVASSFTFPVPTTGEEAKVFRPLLHAALFGGAGDMEYAGFEDKGLAQVRYVHSGARKIFMLNIEDLVQYLGKEGESLADVIHSWKNMSFWQLVQANLREKVIAVCQPAGSMLYVPPAWLVLERVENGKPLVGIRRSFIGRSTTGMSEVECFSKLLPLTNSLKEVAELSLKLMQNEKKENS